MMQKWKSWAKIADELARRDAGLTNPDTALARPEEPENPMTLSETPEAKENRQALLAVKMEQSKKRLVNLPRYVIVNKGIAYSSDGVMTSAVDEYLTYREPYRGDLLDQAMARSRPPSVDDIVADFVEELRDPIILDVSINSAETKKRNDGAIVYDVTSAYGEPGVIFDKGADDIRYTVETMYGGDMRRKPIFHGITDENAMRRDTPFPTEGPEASDLESHVTKYVHPARDKSTPAPLRARRQVIPAIPPDDVDGDRDTVPDLTHYAQECS